MKNIFLTALLVLIASTCFSASVPLSSGTDPIAGSTLTLSGTTTVASYERHIQLEAVSSGLPANQAPLITVDSLSCLSFANAGGKYAYVQWEIPSDWAGDDITIEVDWFPESAAVGASETVNHLFTYRSIAEGELTSNGTVATTTSAYTDSGAGTAQYTTTHTGATFTYNHANQPLVIGDHLYIQVERTTDTFTGDTCVPAFEVLYNSTTLTHNN